MNKELRCIMLVDDNPDDNFFHEREIKKNNSSNIVITKNTGIEALEYLKSDKGKGANPDLIFLDINMPGMNGWEFLEQYSQLDKQLQSKALIIMLTTSDNSDDLAKVKQWSFVSDYITKPLTREIMQNIINKHFQAIPLKV